MGGGGEGSFVAYFQSSDEWFGNSLSVLSKFSIMHFTEGINYRLQVFKLASGSDKKFKNTFIKIKEGGGREKIPRALVVTREQLQCGV